MNKRRNKSKLMIRKLLVFVLLITAGLVGFFVWTDISNKKPIEESTIENVDEEKESEIEFEGTENKAEGEKQEIKEDKKEKKVEQYDGDDPNDAESLSGVVTYAGVNGNNLVIRVNIDQYLTSGQCKLALMKDEVVAYSDVVNIAGGPSTASCEGFDVPISKIGSGDIEIVVEIKSGDKNGVIRGRTSI